MTNQPAALAQAIARHKAAQAALDAAENTRTSRCKCLPPKHLSDEEDDVIISCSVANRGVGGIGIYFRI
jgi:hypothetical protein